MVASCIKTACAVSAPVAKNSCMHALGSCLHGKPNQRSANSIPQDWACLVPAPTSLVSRSHQSQWRDQSRLITRAVTIDVTPTPSSSSSQASASFEFVCPICLQTHFKLSSMPSSSEGLQCPRCSRTFSSDARYVDLTLTSGMQPRAYNQKSWNGTELFRSPLVSFAYERGWRQGFSWAGFPGVDKEFDLAMRYLQPGYGEVLVDMSCGSGLFSRRFAKSGKFAGVVAADFSESMLQQAKAFCDEDAALKNGTPIVFLRADIGRLPFATGSVAALHAGAAIHCWPNPQAALAEISRVLKPGGVFVASTFLGASAPLGQVLGDDLVQPLNVIDVPIQSNYRWWQEAELRELCETMGLQNFTRTREWRFIMFAATKPVAAQ